MKKLFLFATIASCAVALQAQSYLFTATLNGSSETTPNASPGTGTATITLELNDPLNLNDNTLSYSVSYSNLSAITTAAHIHGPAAPGSNASVILGFTGPFGTTSGSFVASNVAANPTVTSALLNGLAYVNIHTTAIPSGEIRGQATLVAVPEADSAMLVGGVLGLGALAWRARRK